MVDERARPRALARKRSGGRWAANSAFARPDRVERARWTYRASSPSNRAGGWGGAPR